MNAIAAVAVVAVVDNDPLLRPCSALSRMKCRYGDDGKYNKWIDIHAIHVLLYLPGEPMPMLNEV